MIKLYLTTEDAADLLQISKRYLERLRATGGGPKFITMGKVVRYTPEDIKAWSDQQKRRTTSDPIAAEQSASAIADHNLAVLKRLTANMQAKKQSKRYAAK